MISKRALQTPVLPTQRDAARVRELEQEGVKVWKLQQGDPQFPTPEAVFAELKNYSDKSITYPGGAGLQEHVQAWKTFYAKQGFAADQLYILPTCGASEAIHMALFTVTDPGDEVLVFAPVYSGFAVIAGMLDCKLIPIDTGFSDRYAVPARSVWEKKITSRTKALILINPDNPTGRVVSPEELTQIAQFAADHDLVLIVDETYRDLYMPGIVSMSALALTAHHDRLILIDSLSKRAGVPGMRVGAFVAYNKIFRDQALKFAFSRSATGRIEQKVSIPLLLQGEEVTFRNRAELCTRIQATIEGLKHIPEIQICEPQGGMFVVVKLPGINIQELLQFFLEQFRLDGQTVTFLSLKDFYLSPDHGHEEVRFAAIYPPEQMTAAIRVFAEGLAAYRATKT